MPWRRQRKSLVAVDRGACSLRAAQLIFDGGCPRVAHWLNVEHRPSAEPGATPGSSANGSQGTAAAPQPGPTEPLATGLEQFGAVRAGLVVGAPDVDYCLLSVPEALWAQGPAEVAEAIRWEVGRQLTWPVEEAELAAWPLPSAMGGGSNAMAVAARRAGVVSAVEVLQSHRMECEWVEPAGLAFIRACRASSGCEHGEIWGVLDLGHSANRLYLAVDSVAVYARQVRGSGHVWTQAIAQELRTDYGTADQYKRRYGIDADARGGRVLMGSMQPLNEAALPGVLLSVLKGSLGELVGDVERAFRFVMEQYPRRAVGSLVLAGGGSRLRGLREWIAKELGIQVVQASAEGAMKVAEPHPLSRPATYAVMAGCVGLALAFGPEAQARRAGRES